MSATKAQRDPALDVALGAVVEQGPRPVSHRGGGVGEVVGQDLVRVEAGGGEAGDGRVDHRLGGVDHGERLVEGFGHESDVTGG